MTKKQQPENVVMSLESLFGDAKPQKIHYKRSIIHVMGLYLDKIDDINDDLNDLDDIYLRKYLFARETYTNLILDFARILSSSYPFDAPGKPDYRAAMTSLIDDYKNRLNRARDDDDRDHFEVLQDILTNLHDIQNGQYSAKR